MYHFFQQNFFFVRSHSGKKEFIYNRGQYSWQFQFHLTDYLPPTINDPHDYPHAQYRL
jgi:hypothetical protein